MTSLNPSKKQKGKRVYEDSDKEWTPPSGNTSSDSYVKSPSRKLITENSDVRSSFQRVWSEEEEIAILQAHLNFSLLKDANPSSDYASFHKFVKDELETETSRTQLQEKLRRLRKKYYTNVDKRRFSKPHEEKLFKLSKRIWGQGDKVKTSEKTNVSSEKCSDLVLGGGSADDLEDWFRRNPRGLIGEKERTEMLEKSQSVKIAKAQQYLLEIQVMEEQAKLATDALQAILN